MAQQTAVEWLQSKVLYIVPSSQKDDLLKLFEQAKQMEKEQMKSIELPSDEEIGKESHNYFMRGQLGFEAAADTERAFLRGVLWMKEQILNQNK